MVKPKTLQPLHRRRRGNYLRHTYDTHVMSFPPDGGWWSGLNEDDWECWQGLVMEWWWVQSPRPGSCHWEPVGQGSACINKHPAHTERGAEELCRLSRRQVSALEGSKVIGEPWRWATGTLQCGCVSQREKMEGLFLNSSFFTHYDGVGFPQCLLILTSALTNRY